MGKLKNKSKLNKDEVHVPILNKELSFIPFR